MNLFQSIRNWAKRSRFSRWHNCRIEQMESRELLSANLPGQVDPNLVVPAITIAAPPKIQLGAVYFEEASNDDATPADRFSVSYTGGAAGTQLTQLVINTDKAGDGLTPGDIIFDTAPGGLGVFGSSPFTVVEHNGFNVDSYSVVDGGTTLIINLSGFDPGEKLVFGIDCDEYQPPDVNAVVEGKEFAGSIITGSFSAPHYNDATIQDTYTDAYDQKLAGRGLDLPPDNYVPPSTTDRTVYTAGAAGEVVQQPLPAKLSGHVYEDLNLDQARQPGETLLVGVQVSLLMLSSGQYVDTGLSQVTDANGYYEFGGLLPGVYQVVETQPGGYYSVSANPGTVDGGTRGYAATKDILAGIPLLGGDNSINNDFGEARYAKLCGYVYEDLNANDQHEAGEPGIANVSVQLRDANGNVLRTATTNADGKFCFTELEAGTYTLTETTPNGYIDAYDRPGDAGGVAVNPGDQINNITLAPGQHGTQYNFGEVRPGSVSGYVHAEINEDCIRDPNEPWLAGVTMHLYDADGTLLQTTTTDANGYYEFTGLRPGSYTVFEEQPSNYLNDDSHIGSAGGTIVSQDRMGGITILSGTNGVHYDYCELMPASISGYVFIDGDPIRYKEGTAQPDIFSVKDGVRRAGDTMLEGILLQLCDENGNALHDASTGKPITTRTDANGYYEFKNLRPGTYTVVQVQQPAGLVDGIDTAGTTGGIAVNANVKLDNSISSTLAIDPRNDAILRIQVGAGQTSIENNFSEVRFETYTDPPPPPPPPDPPTYPPDSPPSVPSPRLDVPQLGGGSPTFYGQPSFYYAAPAMTFGGVAMPAGNTWHLSIINGGQPRRDGDGLSTTPYAGAQIFDPTTWTGPNLGQSQWIVANVQGEVIAQYVFGMPGAIPVAGDFAGIGHAQIGVYYKGNWFLDLNDDHRWDADDLWARLGTEADLPVVGDWDGDGKYDIGIFGPRWPGDARALQHEPGLPDAQNQRRAEAKNPPPDPQNATIGQRTMQRGRTGRARSDLIDHVFEFGQPGDIPVVGDWNGDGIKTVGVFRGGLWYLDMDGDGHWSPGDVIAEFGQQGDLPVVGDWIGDGKTKLGVFRNGKFILDTNNNRTIDSEDAQFTLGGAGDKPVAGDFNADGVDDVAVYQDTPRGR